MERLARRRTIEMGSLEMYRTVMMTVLKEARHSRSAEIVFSTVKSCFETQDSLGGQFCKTQDSQDG